jgi:thiamine transport system ATP-binding protein
VTPRLDVEDASVRFGPHQALDRVHLEVAQGEVVAVLGPSGSGKSTLLRAIAGLQPIDGGRILLDGVDLAGVPPHRRGVGLMFQDHALFPHRDVAGNVGFGLRMQQRPRAEVAARVSELLELVDLPGRERRAVHTLSGGEQQRVALARALAPNPRALLLDEPLGALDRTLRDRLVGELRALFTHLELTVVAVTHDQSEAFAMADRIVVMDAGTVLRAGRPADVWDQPGTRRVAEILGLANLVDVVVSGGRALTPWGPMAVAAGDGPATLLIRASGVVVDTDGPIEGTVVASTFQGDQVVLELSVAAAGARSLIAHVDPPLAPPVGARVRMAVAPFAVVPLLPVDVPNAPGNT